ncbi:FxLYD domain-containing protein [Natronococcus occultus]|uniref:Uncharacterized protein n=1 Tax=Natronococcus occultus SP4 TaxID=694430 RepID=L0JWT9_9EURY|nr:FxLYD domain-containing protein [Natronococcus occultus]AGB36293.1 hypothetical protein Natoc_0428 [Natronococcus occultus SP4]
MKLTGSSATGSGPIHKTASRRRFLVGVGTASGIAVAGCVGNDGGDGDPAYQEGTIDVDGEPRTAEEMSAAQGLAEQEIRVEVTPMDALELVDHEFVLEDDYRGATVQGTVENVGDERLEIVELRSRVYDDQDDQLGRYLDSTGDLDSGETWSFQVVVLESPEDLAAYDAAVFGMPE